MWCRFCSRLIDQLNGPAENTDALMESEPPFEVEDIRNEPGGYDFEIGLSDEIAHVWSLKVDWRVRRLSREDGVREVIREDGEVILVRAPSWTTDALEAWLGRRLRHGLISTLMLRLRQ